MPVNPAMGDAFENLKIKACGRNKSPAHLDNLFRKLEIVNGVEREVLPYMIRGATDGIGVQGTVSYNVDTPEAFG